MNCPECGCRMNAIMAGIGLGDLVYECPDCGCEVSDAYAGVREDDEDELEEW